MYICYIWWKRWGGVVNCVTYLLVTHIWRAGSLLPPSSTCSCLCAPSSQQRLGPYPGHSAPWSHQGGAGEMTTRGPWVLCAEVYRCTVGQCLIFWYLMTVLRPTVRWFSTYQLLSQPVCDHGGKGTSPRLSCDQLNCLFLTQFVPLISTLFFQVPIPNMTVINLRTAIISWTFCWWLILCRHISYPPLRLVLNKNKISCKHFWPVTVAAVAEVAAVAAVVVAVVVASVHSFSLAL